MDELPQGDPLRDRLQPIIELTGRALQHQEREARPAELKRPTLPSRKDLVTSLKDTNEMKPKRARAFDAVQAAMREAWPALTSSQRSQRLRADDGKRAAEVEARRRARSEKPPAWGHSHPDIGPQVSNAWTKPQRLGLFQHLASIEPRTSIM